MVWTAPRTWATGEVVTAALLNTHLRDNLLAIRNPETWTTYTPNWTGSVSNPAIGNGVLTGRYLQIGKVVHFRIDLLTGSTTTFGSGNYAWQMPVTASTSVNTAFTARLFDNSASTYLIGVAVPVSTTACALTTHGSTAVATPTVPITWGQDDRLLIAGHYEAA